MLYARFYLFLTLSVLANIVTYSVSQDAYASLGDFLLRVLVVISCTFVLTKAIRGLAREIEGDEQGAHFLKFLVVVLHFTSVVTMMFSVVPDSFSSLLTLFFGIMCSLVFLKVTVGVTIEEV